MHDDKRYKYELLDLLHRVEVVLSREGINYFAVYGTCLGAAREHGIIPWDDDIDIAVWRYDFTRALEVLSSSHEQIYAGDRTTVPGCPSRCGRIFNRVGHDSCVERKRAYIDLHVIDYAPQSRIGFWLSVLGYVGISRIVSRRGSGVGNNHRLVYIFADLVFCPFRIFPTNILSKFADWIYIGKRTSAFVKITFDGNRKRYPAKLFSGAERVPFDKFVIPLPVGYDEYLTWCYGDWRTPPPPNERLSHAFDKEGREWNVPIPDDSSRPLKE